jgi:hypothetical protein
MHALDKAIEGAAPQGSACAARAHQRRRHHVRVPRTGRWRAAPATLKCGSNFSITSDHVLQRQSRKIINKLSFAMTASDRPPLRAAARTDHLEQLGDVRTTRRRNRRARFAPPRGHHGAQLRCRHARRAFGSHWITRDHGHRAKHSMIPRDASPSKPKKPNEPEQRKSFRRFATGSRIPWRGRCQ